MKKPNAATLHHVYIWSENKKNKKDGPESQLFRKFIKLPKALKIKDELIQLGTSGLRNANLIKKSHTLTSVSISVPVSINKYSNKHISPNKSK